MLAYGALLTARLAAVPELPAAAVGASPAVIVAVLNAYYIKSAVRISDIIVGAT